MVDSAERDPRRRFNARERTALYLAADGRCTRCDRELEPGWHADHRDPHSRGGLTDVVNGQATCPRCNLTKGDRVTDQLRDWQRDAIRRFDASGKRDFLICATPGAGKTRLALALADRVLAERSAERVVVVVPTDELRTQWVDDAAACGIDLMPVAEAEDYDKRGYHGCVVTYQQLGRGSGADLLRRATSTPTLAVLDEIHHAGGGDNPKAWGLGLERALEHAVRRIGLTGTPWRRDPQSPIPFVEYDPDGKVKVDSEYEYGVAVVDGVCRRIEFHAYDGQARWVDCGAVETRQLAEVATDEETSAALTTVLDPDRDWMPGVLDAAVDSLRELRREVPDAGGLLVCDRAWQAKKYAEMLEARTGEQAVVAISDDAESADNIGRFRSGSSPWLVAIKMVSEGVDIKRLAVGVYATKVRTPLFFRQVVGRFVRTRPGEEINAKLFIPAVEVFLAHAREIEDQLRHQLDIERERMEKAEQQARDGQQTFELREPISASDAQFATSIFGGQEADAQVHARAAQLCRELNIPAQFAPNMVPVVIAEQRSAPVAEVTVTPTTARAPRVRVEKTLRGEIKTLVNKIAQRAGKEPQDVNIDILKAGYPPRAQCSVEQLEGLRNQLARWLGEM